MSTPLAELGQIPDWVEKAICAQVDPALFFPPKGGDAQPAKNICAECPVAAACLDWGMQEEFGIYGGYSPKERRALRHGRTCVDCEALLVTPSAQRCRTCANIRRRRQQRELDLACRRARAALKETA